MIWLIILAVIVIFCVGFYVWSVRCRKTDIRRRKEYLRSTRWKIAGFKRPRPGREIRN
jgi:hypothetical protein